MIIRPIFKVKKYLCSQKEKLLVLVTSYYSKNDLSSWRRCLFVICASAVAKNDRRSFFDIP